MPNHRSILAASCALLLATLATPSASAALLSWDPNATNGISPGGDGTWDFAAGPTPWYNTATLADVAWSDGNDALFGGNGGTINVGAAVVPLSVKFDGNYTLSGAAITTATLSVKAGTTTTINDVLSGINVTIGLASTSTYAGTLILGGASNYTGTTLINSGIVKLGVTNALPIGTALTGSGNPGSTFDLNGFNQTLGAIMGASQSTITNTSATRSTLTVTGTMSNSSQLLTGNLNVTKTGTGAWNPAVNHTFTGLLTLAGGTTSATTNNNLGAVGQASVLLDGTGANTPVLAFNVTAFSVAADFNRNIELAGSGGRLAGSGVKASSISGVISGSGDLRYGSVTQGALILAGNNTYTGLTKIENTGTELIAASNNAFGSSPMISQSSSSTSGTIGFQKSLTNQNINIGSTTDITFQASNHSSGLGSIHNFNGDNSFGGDIFMSASTQLYAAESGSSLTLTGVISGTRPFVKGYGGTIVLTGANTYTGATTVNTGTLRLDFGQAAGTDNIINNLSNSSALTLAGGALEIKGRNGATANNQQFNGLTVAAGASAIVINQNANTAGVNLNLGTLATRAVGGSIDFTLPTTGTIATTSGVSNAILTSNSNGVAYATVGGNDWAAKDVTNSFIVGGSTIAGFYTPNDATTLDGNADMSGGVDTDLGLGFATLTSLRFNNSTGRDITNGTIQTGGILVTAGVGANPTTITNGFLIGPAGKDLVIVHNNPGSGCALTISSTVIDNSTSGLTKAGAGTVNLAASNSYLGATTVVGGVLELTDPNALPGGVGATGGTSNLNLKGGVVGLTGNFSRALGAGSSQVQFTGSGGFAAYGADRTVNFGGTATWGSGPLFRMAPRSCWAPRMRPTWSISKARSRSSAAQAHNSGRSAWPTAPPRWTRRLAGSSAMPRAL